MKIALVVTGGVDRSGRERVIPALLCLVERLARRHAVTVYVLRYHTRPCSYELLGATVHDLGRPAGTVAQYRALCRAIRRDGPFDVIHAYWALPSGLAACAVARRLGIPSVLTLDSGELVALNDIGYGLQRTVRQRVAVAAAARMATATTVCTEYMKRLALARGISATLIPFGIDAARYERSEADGAPPWRLLHVACLNPVKDQPTLLHALRLVARRGASVHLDVVGEDTLSGSVQRLAWRLGLADAVTFHGFQPSDALAGFYRRAHVNVLSSRHEAAGVVVLEAAAAGVPTVGTDVGYVADWAPERASAVPVGDPAALADAIVEILSDENRRTRIGAAAHDWARTYNADWTAARLEQLYRDAGAA